MISYKPFQKDDRDFVCYYVIQAKAKKNIRGDEYDEFRVRKITY